MIVKDVDTVIKLALSAKELRTGTDAPQFWGAQTLKRWLKGSLGILKVACSGDNIFGFILVSFNPDSRDAYVNSIVVASDMRRKGLGAKLLSCAEDELVNRGCNHIFGLVKAGNRASQQLLLKRGYQNGDRFVYMQKTLGRVTKAGGGSIIDD